MSNTIICADSTLAGRFVKKESVDLILTDVPYAISRTNNFDTMGRTGIDFGHWDHGFELDQLYDLTKLLRKGGSFITFHSFQQCDQIEMVLVNLDVKDKLFYQKSNPQPRNVNRRYVPDIEMASWFVKPGQKWVFNKNPDSKYERTVMKYPIPTALKKYHPTSKPIGLLEELILRHSNPGDLIFDSFAGSMTCVVAASRTGRNCIAFERDPTFFERGKSLLIKEKILFEEIGNEA